MQLVQYFTDGTMSFNWESLPPKIKERTDLRDKIFKELQEKMKIESMVTSQSLLELNLYAINRIRAEIKGVQL